MSAQLAALEVAVDDGTTVIRIRGEIDLSNADRLDSQIRQAVAPTGAVLVDLTSVAYMDSQAVRLLHRLAAHMHGAGVPFTVVAPRDSIAGELLELTRLSHAVPVRETLEP